MGGSAEGKATARWARAQHRAIGAWMVSIGGLLKELGEAEPRADQTAEALRHLEYLARELSEHFAGEEAPDGMFAKALDAAPRLERRVLALRGQHAPLRAELKQILEDAAYAGVAADVWRRVAEAFDVFAAGLRAHELAENRIVTDAYLEDLGAGD